MSIEYYQGVAERLEIQRAGLETEIKRLREENEDLKLEGSAQDQVSLGVAIENEQLRARVAELEATVERLTRLTTCRRNLPWCDCTALERDLAKARNLVQARDAFRGLLEHAAERGDDETAR